MLELLQKLYAIRHTAEHAGFKLNSRNVPECQLKADVKITIKDAILHYADQNPNGRSNEAKLVRAGIFQSHEVGWLWTDTPREILGHSRIWLGKITPKETTPLAQGNFNKETNILNIEMKGQ
jgi:hypothetical protein